MLILFNLLSTPLDQESLRFRWRNAQTEMLVPSDRSSVQIVDIENIDVPTNIKCNGKWSAWKSWSDCSSSCGDGQKTRKRECFFDRPDCTGDPCLGSDTDVESCMGNDPECRFLSLIKYNVCSKSHILLDIETFSGPFRTDDDYMGECRANIFHVYENGCNDPGKPKTDYRRKPSDGYTDTSIATAIDNINNNINNINTINNINNINDILHNYHNNCCYCCHPGGWCSKSTEEVRSN